jgi:2-phospho-L-lactate guanylyltransferase
VAVPHAADAKNVAVLLGDLPALQPRELSAALALATRHPLSMVPDAAGTGTTLLTALAGATHVPAFGAGSAAAHRASGYVPLAVAADSGLRTDVDTVHDLTALIAADRTLLGRHTREFLDVGSPSLFGL